MARKRINTLWFEAKEIYIDGGWTKDRKDYKAGKYKKRLEIWSNNIPYRYLSKSEVNRLIKYLEKVKDKLD